MPDGSVLRSQVEDLLRLARKAEQGVPQWRGDYIRAVNPLAITQLLTALVGKIERLQADSLRWQCVHCGLVGDPQKDRQAKWDALIEHRKRCDKAKLEWAQMPLRRSEFVISLWHRLEAAEAKLAQLEQRDAKRKEPRNA